MTATHAWVFAIGLALAGVVPQPARIGRLPILAPFPKSRFRCRSDVPVTAAMRRVGVAALAMVDDSSSGRLITLGSAPGGQPRTLMVLLGDSTGPRRREAETVSVFFKADGRVERGDRRAFTSGIPARSSEVRESGLLPADSAQAISLAREVRDKCRA